MLHMTLMNVISTVSLARKLFYPQGFVNSISYRGIRSLAGKNSNTNNLKGQFHKIFEFRFFHEPVSPRP